jgi:hypothetical protein
MEELQEQLPNNKAPQLAPYQFKKGQSGNPKGRPPGKSVKERAKAMLAAMTNDEFEEFLQGIDKKTIWEMAEGKARQDTDVTSGGDKIVFMPLELIEKHNINETNTSSESDS